MYTLAPVGFENTEILLGEEVEAVSVADTVLVALSLTVTLPVYSWYPVNRNKTI